MLKSYQVEQSHAYFEQMMAQPAPTPVFLWELAREYFRRTEAFDRTICTGPVLHDGVMPSNPREQAAITRNAESTLRELRNRAEFEGHTYAELRQAMKRYVLSADFVNDMQTDFPVITQSGQ